MSVTVTLLSPAGFRRAHRRHGALRRRRVLADRAGTQHRRRQRPHRRPPRPLVQRAHRTLSFQLSGAQVGISITTLITGYLAEPLVAQLLAPAFAAIALYQTRRRRLALALALLIATSVSMVFGELVAQYLAVAQPLATARVVAGPQLLFSMLTTPADQADQRHRQLDPAPAGHRAGRRAAVGALAAGTGVAGAQLRAQRRRSIPPPPRWCDRSLQFGTRTAEELMTPRSKIEALQSDDTVADLVDKATETGYSRFPIVEGDLDETIGIVHVKQVFEVPRADRPRTRLAGLAQPVPMVPSTLDGDAVMAQIRANGLQTALVVDEYGGTAGMVTVEDLIEEIVGDVRDEHDDATPDVVRDAQRLAGVGPAAHRRGRHGNAGSGRPKASTRPSAAWCCRSSATFRSRASRSS